MTVLFIFKTNYNKIMSSTTKIRISRSKYIERDRSIAILRLEAAEHLLGQPVMVRYYTDSTQTEYDTILRWV